MTKYLISWYRWMFNPFPIQGEEWMLDGLGRVRVEGVQYLGNAGALIYFRQVAKHEGDSYTTDAGTFRARGYPWQPQSLLEVKEP